MPFSRPTLTEIVTRMQTDVETRLVTMGNLLRRSVVRVIVYALAGAVHLVYGFLNYMTNQLFASTADTDFLERIAAEYGLYRASSEYATGSGTVTATQVTTIASGTRLQSSAGVIYLVEDGVTTIVGSNTIDFTAEEAGADGNDDPGITLSFVSPITGVSNSITVDSSGIGGGADEETDTQLRERVLLRRRKTPHGGAAHDYINWAKSYSGVTRAWVYPSYAGLGTVAIAFVMDGNADILPNETQRIAVAAFMDQHVNTITGEEEGVPVTASAGFEIVELVDYPIDLVIEIYPNTTDIQDAITTELDNYLLSEGGPAETLYLSEISQVISGAAGEERHRIISPVDDVTPSFTQMPSFTITFRDYT